MRLKALSIDSFLSFEHFNWQGIDERLNIIVGPNDAGKTSLLRALRMSIDALAADRLPTITRGLFHRGKPDQRILFSWDLELTGDWEIELLRVFIAAALSEPAGYSQPMAIMPPERREQMSTMLATQLRPEHINLFLRGRLTMIGGPSGDWSAFYSSLPGEPYFRWDLGGSHMLGLAGRSDPEDGGLQAHDLLRRGLDEAGISAWSDYVDGRSGDAPPMPDMALALSRLEGWVLLRVGGPDSRLMATRRFAELVGVPVSLTSQYGLRDVLRRIFIRSCLFTDNWRRTPTYTFSRSDASRAEFDLASGADLAVALFRLKNGTEVQRERFHAVVRMFWRLTGRSADVVLRTPPPSPADVVLQIQAGQSGETLAEPIGLDLLVRGDWGEVPLEYSGAGVAEALLMSMVLNDDDRVLMLDEPAANLHPNVQSRLLHEIEQQARSQTFVVTHSPALVPAEGLTRVSRFFLEGGRTRRVAVDVNSWPPRKRAALEQQLRASADTRGLLFSRRVIAVEGETEAGALPVWFARRFGRSIEASDTAVYSAGGHPGFVWLLRYLESFAIPWVVVCDGDAFKDTGMPCDVAREARDAGVASVPRIGKAVPFAERRRILSQHGILTANGGAAGKFETIDGIQEHIEEARAAVGDSKPRIGRYIAEKYECPEAVAALLDEIRQRL